MTKKQWEITIDIIKTLGLATVVGSVSDGILSADRRVVDLVWFIIGALGLLTSIWLTKKLNGDKV